MNNLQKVENKSQIKKMDNAVVAYIEPEDKVVYIQPLDNKIILKLTTTEPNQVVPIGGGWWLDGNGEDDYGYAGLKYDFSKVTIDGVEINLDDYSEWESPNLFDDGEYIYYWYYTFSEPGEHTVVATLLDNSIKPESFHFGEYESVVVGKDVTSILYSAFEYNKNLKEVVLSEKLKKLDDNVFGDCELLTSITIPNNVTTIGRGCFANCSSLNNVSMPNTLNQILDNAFMNCTNLTTITLPDKLKWVNNYIFQNCYNLTSIVFKGVVYTSQSELRNEVLKNNGKVGTFAFKYTGLSD